jgi:hypothetical protein
LFKNTSTTGCTLRLLPNTTAKEDQELKHCLQSDAWFVESVLLMILTFAATNGFSKFFPKECIKNALKDAPKGIHIVPEGPARD